MPSGRVLTIVFDWKFMVYLQNLIRSWDELGLVVVLGILALLGGVCLLRPGVIVRFLQRRYDASRLFRMTLFSRMVFKSWYPLIVRLWGGLIWAFVTVAVFAFFESSQ